MVKYSLSNWDNIMSFRKEFMLRGFLTVLFPIHGNLFDRRSWSKAPGTGGGTGTLGAFISGGIKEQKSASAQRCPSMGNGVHVSSVLPHHPDALSHLEIIHTNPNPHFPSHCHYYLLPDSLPTCSLPSFGDGIGGVWSRGIALRLALLLPGVRC